MKNYDKLQFECCKFENIEDFDTFLRNEFPTFLSHRCDISIGRGWWPFILHLAQFMRDNHFLEEVSIAQIKEKFGYLRIYADIISNKDVYDKIYEEIADLESFSRSYCEKCGSKENVSTDTKPNGYWVKTYCDACFKDSCK